MEPEDTKGKYVRLGISAADDKLLDKLADEGYLGAVAKAEVGRFMIQFAIAHFAQMSDWYRDRGLKIIQERKKG